MSDRQDGHERAARDLLASLHEPERHLDFDTELAPYAGGTAGPAEREIVESHLDDCAMCRAEIEDLQRLAPAMRSRRPWRVLALAASLAIAVIAAVLLLARRERAPVQPSQAASVYANAEWARLVEQSLQSGRLPEPVIAPPPAPQEGALRGGAVPKAWLAPSGVVIDTTRPMLAWTPEPGASYVVTLVSGNEEIARSERLAAPRWTVQGDLPRGRIYQWQVEVSRGSAKSLLPSLPAPLPSFRILGAREHDDLERARAAHPRDALLLAALAARYGLADEARARIETLRGSHDPRVQRIVRSVQEGSPSSTKAAQ